MRQRVKTVFFIGLALIALFGMTACPQKAKPKAEEPAAPPDKTYTVKGISFTMKKIAAVTGKSVGHPDIVGHNGAHDNTAQYQFKCILYRRDGGNAGAVASGDGQ